MKMTERATESVVFFWINILKKEIKEVKQEKRYDYYRKKGYSDDWISIRLKGILNRKKLTDIWKEGGINENYEYGMLTNEIYKTWSGMKDDDYKTYKGLRKESLRDNMSDIEVALADLGELATREIAKKKNPKGLKENLEIAKYGGNIAANTRRDLENEIGESVVTNSNALNYKYIDNKRIEFIKDNNLNN